MVSCKNPQGNLVKSIQPILYLALILSGLWSTAASSGGVSDWVENNLIDPEDGKLDVSSSKETC